LEVDLNGTSRKARGLIALASVGALLLGACGGGGTTTGSTGQAAQGGYVRATPESGTSLPQVSVKFGMRPYADNTFYYIGIKKGWFKEVGITITPEPSGLKTTDDVVTSLLLNKQVDINSEYCPLLLPTYKTSKALKCIAFTDNFLGEAILANPNLHLKSFKDYIASGMSFDDAMHAALLPLQSKTLVVAPQLSDRPFEDASFKYAKITAPKLDIMDDSKSLVEAKAGRIDFVNPEGAPIVYTLEQAGWVPLVDIGDLLKHAPGGVGSPIEPLVAIVGIASHQDYVKAHQTTVLRFLSVVFRIMAEVQKDPALYDIQAPFLNSMAGTSLDGKGVESTIKVLDPLAPWGPEQQTFFERTDAVTYYKNAWSGIISTYEQQGTIPKSVADPDTIIWAKPIYDEMKDYESRSKSEIATLESRNLSGDKKKMLDQAKQFFDNYDFLDAYRLARAAAA
jgi:ABC-type nitrate/sulfonate/bicarbonate transport system substrate-binding protein